jgi:hypothetical protein
MIPIAFSFITGGLGKLFGFLKQIPWYVWLGAVVLIVGLALHHKAEKRAYNEAFNAGWSQQHRQLLTLEHNVRVAAIAAHVLNHAQVTETEDRGAKITETNQHDLESQLAGARALAADYARRMRANAAAADPGRPGEGGISQAAASPGGADGAGGVPLVGDADLRICTENTVKAIGWQRFYEAERATFNATGQTPLPAP